MQQKSRMKEYRPGTFEKRVAYGQRDRKLMLIARGILTGFRVVCRSENAAKDLAFALRIRSKRIEVSESTRFGIKVKLDGRKVYVVGISRPAERR